MKNVDEKEKWTFDDAPEWQKCLATVLTSIVVLLLIALVAIFPLYLMVTTRVAWWILLYVIPVGTIVGVGVYLDD